MSRELSIGIRHARAVKEAENHARAVMQASENRWPPIWDEEGRYRWWIETFGTSEDEFEEMATALARRYRRTRPWHVRKRRAIFADYIRVKGLLTAGKGLTTVWR